MAISRSPQSRIDIVEIATYQAEPNGIRVVRVLHGARNTEDIFG